MKRLALLTPLAALAFAAACNDTPLPVTPDDGPSLPPPSLAAAGGVSGANFTTTNPNVDRPGNNPNQKLCLHGQDPASGANNCNHYGAKEYVWLNGGPLTAGLESGTYFWAVLAPGGQPDPNDATSVAGGKNLSDDTDQYTNRTFSWNKATGQITYGGTHDWDKATMKLRVGLKPSPYKPKGPDWYADTPNKGGVYILAICRISPPSSYPVNPRDCKYDAFKVKDQSGPPEVFVNIWTDGVNEVGEDHTFTIRVKAVGGKPPYTFQITPSVDPNAALKSQTCTNAAAKDDFTRECKVTVYSTKVGTVKVGATAKVTDASGYSTTSSTGPDALPNSDDGYKYYVRRRPPRTGSARSTPSG